MSQAIANGDGAAVVVPTSDNAGIGVAVLQRIDATCDAVTTELQSTRRVDVAKRYALAVRMLADLRWIDEQTADADARTTARQTAIRRFSQAWALGIGTKEDAKEPYRVFKLAALHSGVDDDTRKDLESVSWDAARVLTRWVRWDADKDEFSFAFSVNIPTNRADVPTEQTVDATELIGRVVRSLAAAPMSASGVREKLDDMEREARDARIALLSAKDRAHVERMRQQAAQEALAEKRDALVATIKRTMKNLAMTGADLLAALESAKVVVREDTPAPQTMTEEDARATAALMVHAGNDGAIMAMLDVFTKYTAGVTGNVQTSRGATATLDALGATRKIA